MARVLLVDDEPGVRFTLQEVLSERGMQTVSAASGPEALKLTERFDAAVVDFSMPGMDGVTLLTRLRERDPALPVLLLTAHGSERIAVKAMKAGAYDYLTKPFDIDEVALAVERALEARSLRAENKRLVAERAIGRRVVGDSAAMQRLLESVERVAGRDVTVLARGETGTGKELVAALLHAQSKRSAGPLVKFNCAAIPGELADAELFGHAKGAFTGAGSARKGYFAQADGGTLVPDEVGEIPLTLQPKLLRALQEGEIQPVGSGRIERVDVRIVASTHRDLAADVRAGRFREDLYYRLAVVELMVPPLRERREDIPALAAEFARHYAEKFGLESVRLSPALVAHLSRAEWPGNVRELENTLARLVALSDGRELGVESLAGGAVLKPIAASADESEEGAHPAAGDRLTLREQVEAFERGLIANTLRQCGGNQSEAARRLGTSRVTLIDKIHKYALG